MMQRHCRLKDLLISLNLLLAPPAMHGAECGAASPDAEAGSPGTEVRPRKLSAAELKSISSLFRDLEGRWVGFSAVAGCGEFPSDTHVEDDELTLRAEVERNASDGIDIHIDMNSTKSNSLSQQVINLYLVDGFLRQTSPGVEGDVETGNVGDNKLSFMTKGRHLGEGGTTTWNESLMIISRRSRAFVIEQKQYNQGTLRYTQRWTLEK